jgi:hypothetical protein
MTFVLNTIITKMNKIEVCYTANNCDNIIIMNYYNNNLNINQNVKFTRIIKKFISQKTKISCNDIAIYAISII